jgi:hypothetical protein
MDTTWEDVAFLREFRTLIDEYLVLGYAPTDRNPKPPREVIDLAKRKGFGKLRERVNRATPRATRLVTRLGVKTAMTEYPAKGAEGQVLRFDLFDLVVRNRTFKDLDRSVFLDRIDQALGLLEVRVDKGLIRRPDGAVGRAAAGTLFVAMTADLEVPDREDVFDAIKHVADDLGLDINRVLDAESSNVVTDRDRRELELAQFVVVDLTDAAPAVYLQAGLALALGRTTIPIARQGTVVSLDLPDCPVTYFASLRELREKLTARLNEAF